MTVSPSLYLMGEGGFLKQDQGVANMRKRNECQLYQLKQWVCTSTAVWKLDLKGTKDEGNQKAKDDGGMD